MTALADKRMSTTKTIKFFEFPLAAGKTAYQGGMACIDTSTGDCVPGAAGSATLIPIGSFAENVDNSAGAAAVSVTVELPREVDCTWWENDTTTPVVAADLLQDCYILDDQTVTGDATGNSKAGVVLAVDATKGVCVASATLAGL